MVVRPAKSMDHTRGVRRVVVETECHVRVLAYGWFLCAAFAAVTYRLRPFPVWRILWTLGVVLTAASFLFSCSKRAQGVSAIPGSVALAPCTFIGVLFLVGGHS